MPEPSAPMAKGRLPDSPPCPFCSESETELMNAFGSQLSVSTYWCRRCRSPFEFMKWLEPADPVRPASGGDPATDPTRT